MRIRLLVLIAIVLTAAACGSGSDAGSGTTSSSVATPGPSPSLSPTADAPTSTTSRIGDDPSEAEPAGPVAPDFTLALSDGSTFVLSETDKPVYLIFWAEW